MFALPTPSGVALEQQALDLGPQRWVHPLANRRVALQLDDAVVQLDFYWMAAKRRTIGIQINSHGLQVRAPRWVSHAEVETLLQSRARWIVQKLRQLQVLPQGQSHVRLPWSDGAYLAWQGQYVRLALGFAGRRAGMQVLSEPESLQPGKHIAGAAAIMLQSGGQAGDGSVPQAAAAPAPVCHVLHLPLPLQASQGDIAAMAQRWLRQQAQEQLLQRSAYFSPIMQVTPTRLALTSANTRWGSASSSGAIRLHWRLAHMDPLLFDYVLVHELAHLHEMNHSAQFWAWVEKVMPSYAEYRLRLKHIRLEAWTL